MPKTQDQETPLGASPKRWQATIWYRSDSGPLDVTFDIEELEEVHDLVEHGPLWDTIERIEITLQRPALDAQITVEQAAIGLRSR